MFCIMGMSSPADPGAEKDNKANLPVVARAVQAAVRFSGDSWKSQEPGGKKASGFVAGEKTVYKKAAKAAEDAKRIASNRLAAAAGRVRERLDKTRGKRVTLVGGTEVTRTLVGKKMGVVQSLAAAASSRTETANLISAAGNALKEQLQLLINIPDSAGVKAKQKATDKGWAYYLQWIPDSNRQTRAFWKYCNDKNLLNLLGMALFVYTTLFATVAAFLDAIYAPPIAAVCTWGFITVLEEDPLEYELWVMGIVGGEFGAAVATWAHSEWWLVTIVGVPFTLAFPALANTASKYVRYVIGPVVNTVGPYLGGLLGSLSLSSGGRGLKLGKLGDEWDRPLIRELKKGEVYKRAVNIVDGAEIRAGEVPGQVELYHIKKACGDLDEYQVAFVISKLRATAKEDMYAVRAQAAKDVDIAKRATKAVLSRLGPLLSDSPSRIGTMFNRIAIVCLLPVLLPIFAIIAVLQVMAPLASKRFSLGGVATLAGLAFVEYSVVVYVAHVDTQVALVAGIFIAVSAVGAFANRNALLAGALLAVAFEAAVTAHDVVLADQVVYTLSAFLAIVVVSKADPSFLISVEYAAGWLLFRVLRLSTEGGASAESRWRAAQIMLLVVILVHFMRRFARRAQRGSPEHTIVYKAGARLETQVSGTLILLVALIYADQDVLPMHINVWGIVLPLAYAICVTVPHEKRIKLTFYSKTLFSKLVEGVACLGVIYIIGLCFMYTRSAVLTGTPADPCNPLLTNLHTCANGEQGTYVISTCCRKKTYMLVPEANWPRVDLRTAPVQECEITLSWPTKFKDCCNNDRTEATDSLLGGPKACLCNSNVAGNAYSENLNACVCNANYTGTACHIPVL